MRLRLSLLLLCLALTACAPQRYYNIPGTNSVGSLGEPYTEFRGVAASSPADIWAVGVTHAPALDLPAIQHWDGKAWSSVAVAPNGGRPDVVNAVSTVGPRNAWAVGYSAGKEGHQEDVLIEHWDGRTWSVVSAPNPSQGWNELDDVLALSATNVWAVGYAKDELPAVFKGNTKLPPSRPTPARVLVEHWDGKSWSMVDAPSPGTNWNQLASVAGGGPKDIWAVGWQQDDGPQRALVERWDGRAWSVMTSVPHALQLRAVASISGTCSWVAGAMDRPGIVERWDGSAWISIPAPALTESAELWGMSAMTCDDVWLAGDLVGGKGQPLLERWDGASWTSITSPGGVSAGRLSAVLSLSAHDVWIFGTRQAAQPLTLIEHWDGSAWTVIPAPAA
jgi:hypothetical protein